MAITRRSRLTRSARLRLAVVLHGTVAGHVYAATNRRLVFRYDEGWRGNAAAFPLSLSIPLSVEEHGHRATSAFLWGLLPDNPDVLAYWGRLYGVSPTNVVELLSHVGQDCAGAVQLVPPENLDRVLGQPTRTDETTLVEWLSKGDVAELLAALRRNPAAGRAKMRNRDSLVSPVLNPRQRCTRTSAGAWASPEGAFQAT
jgi:serine/threonine-protein kinase HipA